MSIRHLTLGLTALAVLVFAPAAPAQTWSPEQQEVFPVSIVISGNLAVVQHSYSVARENYKKEQEMVSGRYTDVLLKEKGTWRFIAWAGGDDAKK